MKFDKLRNKKLLFITNIPSPYRVDFFNELSEYLNVTVLFEAENADKNGIKFNYRKKFKFKAIFLKKDSIQEKKFNIRIIKYLKKGEYDFIIATNYSYFTEMLGIVYMKLRRIPYFLETDGGLIKKEFFLKKAYKTFLVQGAKGYFSPSYKADEYLSFYGAKNDKIYRYPFTSIYKRDIVLKKLDDTEKKKLKIKLGVEEQNIVLGVGRFIDIKNWELLIKSYAEIYKFHKNIGLYIIGGKDSERYSYLVRKLKVSNIHFLDFMSSECLKMYYDISDVFVLPTRSDVWGLVINEAMSRGLPVISTNMCNAALELVKNGVNGYIVNDKDDFSKKLIFIIENKEVANIYGNNSLKLIKNFTVEKMVLDHLEVFSLIGD